MALYGLKLTNYPNSNAHMNIMQHLNGLPKSFETVYSVIYSHEPHVIMKNASEWLMSGFILQEALAMGAK